MLHEKVCPPVRAVSSDFAQNRSGPRCCPHQNPNFSHGILHKLPQGVVYASTPPFEIALTMFDAHVPLAAFDHPSRALDRGEFMATLQQLIVAAALMVVV